MNRLYLFSKREKVLIFIMVFLALLVGGCSILLKPALDRRFELKTAIAHEEEKKAEMEDLLGGEGKIEMWTDEQRKIFAETASGLYEKMNEEEMGRVLMGLTDASGMVSSSMFMERASLMDMGFQGDGELVNWCVYSALAGGQAVGSESSVLIFLNSISKNPSIKILDFVMGESEDGRFVLDYNVEFYMVDREMK